MTIFVLGVLTALGFWIILMKLGIRKVLNFEVPIDVAFTLGMVAYLAGTISGAMIGVVAGVTLSILLAVSKRVFGVEQLSRKGLLNMLRNKVVSKKVPVQPRSWADRQRRS